MRRILNVSVLSALAAFLTACGDGSGPGSTVSIHLGTVPTIAPTSFAAQRAGAADVSTTAIGLERSNGRLTIDEMWVIVEEFELEPVEEGECDDDVVEVECPDFEQRYFFIEVPTDGSDVQVAVTQASGRFDELEVEIDDAEIDDDDPEDLADAELIRAMFENDILPTFPNWPEKASLVVIGTFEPRNPDGSLGAAEAFTTYFEAEVEVEIDLVPPFDTDTNTEISVRLNPEAWFVNPDGTVWDLAALQGQLVEFEIEMEDGFEIKIDDD